jgi:cobalamin 5'-phosphate synthase/cobalamin synthase
MRRLLAGIAFLTRLPVPARLAFDARDVARATLVFPVVGLLIGGVQALVAALLAPHLPPLLIAALLIAVAALLTGALHLDGLADMADGFGGGRTREDVLRIMRDHAIGAYGAVALILQIAVKLAALSALVAGGRATTALVLGACLSRAALVPLGRFFRYARDERFGLGATLGEQIGPTEWLGATALAVVAALFLAGGWGVVHLAAVAAVAWLGGRYCQRRIGGITGDTMGATSEVCEALVYVLALALPR